jgi:glutathione peroxidase
MLIDQHGQQVQAHGSTLGCEAHSIGSKGPRLVVLGFPATSSGRRSRATRGDRDFCSLTYEVDFPMMRKIDVNGPGAPALRLSEAAPRRASWAPSGVKWYFTKFLGRPKGDVTRRFAPNVEPKALEGAIEALL